MSRDRIRHNAYQSAWRKRNREKCNAWQRAWNNTNAQQRRMYGVMHYANLKNAVINVLTNGEGTCRWCGQGDQDVLCVDHINNDGHKQRKTLRRSSLWQWLVKNDYPDGFQILCFNCNTKKHVEHARRQRLLTGLLGHKPDGVIQ